jgi:serine/threonine protein kinase
VWSTASVTTIQPGPKGGSSLRRIGRYAILEDLAKGGMAQVYLAQKDGSPDICVLKQLLGELAGHATAGRHRFGEDQ